LIPDVKVEIWSDVVCPWCYVGKRRFEQALAAFPHPVEVEWKSFQLDPDATSGPAGHQAARLAEKYGRSVEQAQQMLDSMTATAATEGLDLHFDKAHSASTLDAHRVLHLAHEKGLQDAVKERLLRAHFTDGEAVDDRPTLLRFAAEVGLDAAPAFSDDRYGEAVQADISEARALGISGVPFFVIDRRYGVSGAQTPEVLLSALEQAWSERSPLTVVKGGDACEGEACAV
jgi:predicted DsbA family dithiol-disulfide isomerase